VATGIFSVQELQSHAPELSVAYCTELLRLSARSS